MKCLFYCDPHWSQYSSIVRSRGEKYSTRLENLISSLNWMEQLAWNEGCTTIICGGDFFDSSVLNSEELSALKAINWAPISHIFITGNHETNLSTNEFSTAELFNLCPNAIVISKTEQYDIDNENIEFCFLPYILERNRLTIDSYFSKPHGRRIIFSHNDIKDVQYGSFLSKEGFTVEDIESNCDLYMNGHIHHCGYVTNKIINGGNLTGQNFTEDAYKYDHCVQIIDTNTLNVKFYINPYAFNFYKIDLRSYKNIQDVYSVLNSLKSNSVITLHTTQLLQAELKNLLQSNFLKNIVEYRIIVDHIVDVSNNDKVEFKNIDYVKQFEQFVFNNIGTDEIVKQELNNILR